VRYDFAENEYELDPLANSARGGGPPRKFAGVDIVDPPIPPKRPPGPLPAVPASPVFRVVAALILAGIAVTLLFLLFARH
jgi:hypothetical protein